MANQISIIVDGKIYPLEAVKAAAYTFSDRAYAQIKSKPGKRFEVTLSPKELAKIKNLSGEFLNELLHHAIRLKITASNQKLREYIITQALCSAQPSQDIPKPVKAQILDKKLEKEIEKLLAETENMDYKKDPLGIAVPWEEKYGKKAASKK
ncbi:MAG: His-Xaa-Ser system protein HxsD [Elusimicrobia bacterium]|nr:His-Xaa-Ser system protein HxsD [Elusimicrobiota bacterium]